jgi:lambda family phage portal protein
MKPNLLDRAIGYFAPGAAARRIKNRAAFDILARHYDGADKGRLNNSWRSSSSSANTEIDRAGPLLRNRMRDLVRNNPHAANAVEVLVNHVIGSGIMPRANTGNPRKDKKINDLFEKFSKKCDADGQLDFYGLQTLAFREMVESGDGVVRRRRRRLTDGLPVPVQFQVVETDLIDGYRQGPTLENRFAIQGIEFDLLGNRTAYWMFSTHPGETYVGAPLDLVSKPIPASEIAHLYKKDRTQVRGVPWGSAVLTTFRDLGTYEEAELLRKKLESCMVGVVVNGDEGDSALGLALAGNPNAALNRPGVYDSQGVAVEGFEPGMFVHLEGGKDIKFNQPAATGSYEGYKKASLHTVASGFHIPYLLLSHDLSGANYASSKMGLEPFKRLIEAVQWNFVIPMLCQPLWDWFAEAAFLGGLVDSADIPVKWGTPRMYSADPEKDARATVLEIRSGLKTLPQAISERGEDPDTQLDEIQASNTKLDDRKLILDSDPRRMSINGQTQVPADEKPTPPAD